MVGFLISTILNPLQLNVPQFLISILAINWFLHFLLIICFLGICWNRNNTQLGALEAGKVVLGLYIVLLVLDALIFIVEIIYAGMPYFLVGSVMFFIIFIPPVLLMYLDIRFPESGFYASLSNSAFVLLVWLVLIILGGFFSATVTV